MVSCVIILIYGFVLVLAGKQQAEPSEIIPSKPIHVSAGGSLPNENMGFRSDTDQTGVASAAEVGQAEPTAILDEVISDTPESSNKSGSAISGVLATKPAPSILDSSTPSTIEALAATQRDTSKAGKAWSSNSSKPDISQFPTNKSIGKSQTGISESFMEWSSNTSLSNTAELPSAEYAADSTQEPRLTTILEPINISIAESKVIEAAKVNASDIAPSRLVDGRAELPVLPSLEAAEDTGPLATSPFPSIQPTGTGRP